MLSVAIFDYVETSQWREANILAAGMVVFAFVVILTMTLIEKRSARSAMTAIPTGRIDRRSPSAAGSDDFALDAEFRAPAARRHRAVRAVRLRQDHGGALHGRPAAACRTAICVVDGEIWQDDAVFPAAAPAADRLRVPGSEPVSASVASAATCSTARRAAPARRRPSGIAFDEVVELLGLQRLLERSPHHLSGGERQRVAIGRALLSQPKLLLMDEPLSALDQLDQDEILPFLERLHERLSLPVIYISHDMAEIERLADHLVLMRAGRGGRRGTAARSAERPGAAARHAPAKPRSASMPTVEAYDASLWPADAWRSTAPAAGPCAARRDRANGNGCGSPPSDVSLAGAAAAEQHPQHRPGAHRLAFERRRPRSSGRAFPGAERRRRAPAFASHADVGRAIGPESGPIRPRSSQERRARAEIDLHRTGEKTRREIGAVRRPPGQSRCLPCHFMLFSSETCRFFRTPPFLLSCRNS